MVVYLLRKKSHWALAYLDDFCGAEATAQEATQAYTEMHSTAARLGLDLAQDKCEPPSTRMIWLGFLVDTASMTITIPEDKLTSVLLECRSWTKTKSATKKRIQSLAGKLIHLSKCIQPA